MGHWNARLEARDGSTRLLVTGAEADDLVKAQLPDPPRHPRALVTLLEGLALWSGEMLCIAISADIPAEHSLGLGSAFGEETLWPTASALLHCEFIVPGRRRGGRINGIGDFRSLRQPRLDG
jgi:hypothetical protein